MKSQYTAFKEPHDKVISARVTESQKRTLEESGWTLRNIIDFFLKENNTPQKRLNVKKSMMELEIEKLNAEIDDKKMRVIELERELEEVNGKLGIVNLNGEDYGLDVKNAVDKIVNHFKTIRGGSKAFTVGDYFLSRKGQHFVENQCGLIGVDLNELEELVVEKLCKQD